MNRLGSPRDAGPLDGIRVLELGNFVAAPSAGRMLGEFGAEVIKIEQPGIGDQIRRWRMFRGQTSMMWRTLARNKKSVTIDLRNAEGQELVRKLASRADVVLENYRPGKLSPGGCPRGAAPGEPAADRRADLRLRPDRALPGSARVRRGRRGDGRLAVPHRASGPVADQGRRQRGDQLAGLHAVIGTLMGLWSRDHKLAEQGETVDVALHEAVFSIMEA